MRCCARPGKRKEASKSALGDSIALGKTRTLGQALQSLNQAVKPMWRFGQEEWSSEHGRVWVKAGKLVLDPMARADIKVPRFLTVHPASAGSRLWQKEEDMDRYLIETPHAGPECLGLIQQLNAQGYLWNFDWG